MLGGGGCPDWHPILTHRPAWGLTLANEAVRSRRREKRNPVVNATHVKSARREDRGRAEFIPQELKKKIERIREIEIAVSVGRAAGDAITATKLEIRALRLREKVERSLVGRRCAAAVKEALRAKPRSPVKLIDDAWDTLEQVCAQRGVDVRWFAGALLEEAIYAVAEIGKVGGPNIRLSVDFGETRSRRSARYFEVAENAETIERLLACRH